MYHGYVAVIIPISLCNRCSYHVNDKSQLPGSALQSVVERSELRSWAGRAPAPVAAPYSAVVTGPLPWCSVHWYTFIVHSIAPLLCLYHHSYYLHSHSSIDVNNNYLVVVFVFICINPLGCGQESVAIGQSFVAVVLMKTPPLCWFFALLGCGDKCHQNHANNN